MSKRGAQARSLSLQSPVFPPNHPISPLGAVLHQVILLVYALELIVNRTLYRVLVFMPPSISRGMSVIVDSLGRVFIVLSLALPLLLLAIISPLYYLLLYLAGTILDYTGVAKLSLLLIVTGLMLARREPRRLAETVLLLAMAVHPYIDEPLLFYAANLLWLIVPVPFISKRGVRNLKYSIPIALLLLYATYRSPYIMGQVFIFSMNLVSPWLLPAAIILYSLAPSTGRLSLLLTGPLLQLSNQVLVIASSYAHEFWGEKR